MASYMSRRRLSVFTVQQIYNKCYLCMCRGLASVSSFGLVSLSDARTVTGHSCNSVSFWVHSLKLCPSFLSYTTSINMATSICFQDYDAFGFDLDHTIAKYDLVHLFNIAYDSVTKLLVKVKGYDPSIKGELHHYKDFIFKGLFLDVATGNILKLGPDGTILRATHGTRKMTTEQIQKEYGQGMKWKYTDTIKQTLRSSISEYRFFENYFDCPGLVATARIIDFIDTDESLSKEERAELYVKAWMDTLEVLQIMYTPQHFAEGKGEYFPAVKKEPSKFVLPCSNGIRKWLKSLKQEKKLVFLLTSSHIDYSTCLLEVCLGKDWRSYFDICLFHSRKPHFFSADTPFYTLLNNAKADVATDLERNECYSQGNIEQFSKFICREIKKEQVKVLYFGDNICSDCYPSKHFAGWDTVLVLEEMDAEGYLCSDGTVPGHEDDMENDGPSEPSKKKRPVMNHSSLVSEAEIDYMTTELWGHFLVERVDKAVPKEMNTFWGDVIGRYSDIAVPSLEYLAAVPIDHSFETFGGNPKNLRGFHPGKPSSLLP